MSQAPSQELALRQATQSAVAQLQDPEFAQQVALAVPEGRSPRQMLRVAATAVLENPKLAAPNLRPSLLQATLKCAQDGLLPDGRQAAFIIYRTTKKGEIVQYQPMIGGLRGIAADHGWDLQTAVVYENDQFDPDMDEHRTNHKPTPLGQDRGKPIGAYAIATHRDGRKMGPEVFTLEDIEKRRQVSRAKDDGPWVNWWEAMAEKSPGKRLFKKLSFDPKDRRIASVLEALKEEDATEALYGPAPDARSDGVDAGEELAETGDSPAASVSEGDVIDGEAIELNEPSDDELEALGAGDVTIADEVRFDTGKFEGQTFAEVFAQGKRGIGYLKWALSDWREGELKQALRDFAEAHPELKEAE